MQQPAYPAESIAGSGPLGSGTIYIHWSAVIAGAIVAAAVSSVLFTFGAGIGLAMASPSPSWRNTTSALALLSGLWLLVVAVGSFALGGYIAGRMRARLSAASSDEVEFRDGVHGAMAWALAVLLGAFVAWATATALAPHADRGGAAPPSTTAAAVGEPSFFAYEVDRLFRTGGERRDAGDAAARAEAARLLAASVDERNFTGEDREALARLTSARTSLSGADLNRRVDSVVGLARDKAKKARRSAVIIAFMTAVSLVLGLAAAWFAACVGGRHRDGDTVPSLAWRQPTISVR